MILSQSLQTKRPHSPIAQVVCHVCRQGEKTLFRVRKDGKKTNDYVCEDHKNMGMPNILNSSRKYFTYAEDK